MTPTRLHRAAFSLYALLSLFLTWPLLAQITTHVPGIPQWAFDESTFIWNIWHLKDALVDRLSNPLHTELIWYPLGIDLVLYTYNFFHALFAMPLVVAVNLPFGSNLSLLASTILSGYGVFLLTRYLLLRMGGNANADLPTVAPAVVAGLVYAFASNRAIYAALGHYDMVTTQWIPFYALMLLRSLDSRLHPAQRRKAAALAGLFFAFTGLAEMISALFLAIFTLIVVLLYLARRLDGEASPPQRRFWPRVRLFGTAMLITGAMAFVIWSPVLIPILRQFLTNDFSLQGWGEAIPLSTDLLGWFTPTILHPLWGGDLVAELRRVQLRALAVDGVGMRDLNTVFLGWVTLILALAAGLLYRRRVALWLWTSLIFGLFTLGPFLQINGRYRFDLDGETATFPLPFILLHYLPVIKANRAPNRNSVALMLGLAVLVGYALYWLFTHSPWLRRKTAAQLLVGALLAAAIVFEHLALPLPLSDARIPTVYEQIAADPRPISVLQIPLGWRNSFGVFGSEETLLQYYQSAHGKPILGGNISRAPEFKLDYFKRIAYFDVLTALEFGRIPAPEQIDLARAQAAELANLYNIGYVLLFPPIPQRYPYADNWQQTWAFVKATLPLEPQPFWTGDGIEAYRVVQPPGQDNFTLDLGPAGTFPYRGEGWDAAETDAPYGESAIWATAQTSRLFMPLRKLDQNASYQLSLRLHPFVYPDAPAQSITPTLNGHELAQQPLADDWQTLTWAIPAAALIDGLNRLELAWAATAAPRAVNPGDRQIGSTGVALPIDADLKAFADGGFIALFDEVGEQRDGSAGRRGVNVTVLDRQSGSVEQAVGFDTTANEFESAALAEFLQTVTPGTPVLVVSHGDASAHLTDEAITALRDLGADVSASSLHGQYFAIAGVQGAAPGTAALVIDANEAFLRISLNRDRRPLAAAVDWVTITQGGE